jgi:hypothetical protein
MIRCFCCERRLGHSAVPCQCGDDYCGACCCVACIVGATIRRLLLTPATELFRSPVPWKASRHAPARANDYPGCLPRRRRASRLALARDVVAVGLVTGGQSASAPHSQHVGAGALGHPEQGGVEGAAVSRKWNGRGS